MTQKTEKTEKTEPIALEEWQKHVRVNRVGVNTTWCGRALLPFDFVFMDLDHAFNTLHARERLLLCPDCARALQRLLTESLDLGSAELARSTGASAPKAR